MFGTYYGSAEGALITRKRALRELASHGASDATSIAAFDAECPPVAPADFDKYDAEERADASTPMYDAQHVLAWLGY